MTSLNGVFFRWIGLAFSCQKWGSAKWQSSFKCIFFFSVSSKPKNTYHEILWLAEIKSTHFSWSELIKKLISQDTLFASKHTIIIHKTLLIAKVKGAKKTLIVLGLVLEQVTIFPLNHNFLTRRPNQYKIEKNKLIYHQ